MKNYNHGPRSPSSLSQSFLCHWCSESAAYVSEKGQQRVPWDGNALSFSSSASREQSKFHQSRNSDSIHLDKARGEQHRQKTKKRKRPSEESNSEVYRPNNAHEPWKRKARRRPAEWPSKLGSFLLKSRANFAADTLPSPPTVNVPNNRLKIIHSRNKGWAEFDMSLDFGGTEVLRGSEKCSGCCRG